MLILPLKNFSIAYKEPAVSQLNEKLSISSVTNLMLPIIIICSSDACSNEIAGLNNLGSLYDFYFDTVIMIFEPTNASRISEPKDLLI